MSSKLYKDWYFFWHGKVPSWKFRNKFRITWWRIVLGFIQEFIVWPLGFDKERKYKFYK